MVEKLAAADAHAYRPPPHKKIDYWSDKRNPDGRSLKSITYQGIAEAMAEQWGSL